jgi:heme oxygenase
MLDNHPAFLALVNGSLSLPDYGRLMLAFHGFYSMLDPYLESACIRFSVAKSGFRYAGRTAMLTNDLVALGLGDEAARSASSAGGPAPARSAAALAGMLYVFEGSMLGGAVLCAATETLLAPAANGGNSYWRWCRAAAQPRWAMTCGLIEELADTPAARDEMVAAARDSFQRFAAWFERWAPDAGGAPPC